jgi:hypothetical protein
LGSVKTPQHLRAGSGLPVDWLSRAGLFAKPADDAL